MSQSIRYPHLQLTKYILSRQLGTSVNNEKYPKIYDNESFRYCSPLQLSVKEQNFRVKPRSNNYPGFRRRPNIPKCQEQKLPAIVQPSIGTSLWDFKHEQLRHSIVMQAYIQGKANGATQRLQEQKTKHILEKFEMPLLNIGQIYNLFDTLQLELEPSTQRQNVNISPSLPDLTGSDNNVKTDVCSKDLSKAEKDKGELLGVGNDKSNDKDKNADKDNKDKPTMEQLKEVEDLLVDKLPQFFRGCLLCGKEHSNIMFINKYYDKEETYVGKNSYRAQMAKVFLKMRLVYPRIDVNLLSVEIDEKDGLINVRWQICSISHYRYVLNFVMSLFTETDKSSMEQYIDGFSIYTVGKDGLIHKHEVDRKIRDNNNKSLLEKVTPLASKLMPQLQNAPFSGISSVYTRESEDT